MNTITPRRRVAVVVETPRRAAPLNSFQHITDVASVRFIIRKKKLFFVILLLFRRNCITEEEKHSVSCWFLLLYTRNIMYYAHCNGYFIFSSVIVRKSRTGGGRHTSSIAYIKLSITFITSLFSSWFAIMLLILRASFILLCKLYSVFHVCFTPLHIMKPFFLKVIFFSDLFHFKASVYTDKRK